MDPDDLAIWLHDNPDPFGVADMTPDELRQQQIDDAYDWQLEWKRGE